jgi:hypothetical protein
LKGRKRCDARTCEWRVDVVRNRGRGGVQAVWVMGGGRVEEEGRVSFYGGRRAAADANKHYINNTMPREGKRSA